jgi:bisphosphoglycerate-dependent phosphoglycerate mutase
VSDTLVSLLIGLATGAGVSTFAALFVRRKTKAEAGDLDASAADKVAQAAMRLVPYYDKRIAELEARIVFAETAALSAHESELRCLKRLEEMQTQINELRAQMLHPPVTTTVTTAVTTQDPPTGVTPA